MCYAAGHSAQVVCSTLAAWVEAAGRAIMPRCERLGALGGERALACWELVLRYHWKSVLGYQRGVSMWVAAMMVSSEGATTVPSLTYASRFLGTNKSSSVNGGERTVPGRGCPW